MLKIILPSKLVEQCPSKYTKNACLAKRKFSIHIMTNEVADSFASTMFLTIGKPE
jgi:hypothetical protein